MRKIIYFLSSIIVMALVAGCYKDKGNYDYVPLEEVVIDTTGSNIKPGYAIYRYDTLQINPKIFFNGVQITDEKQVEGKLSFTWTIFQAVTGGTVFTRDTLSHSIKLKSSIAKPQGNWIAHLTVRDLKTLTDTYIRFNVEIFETLSDGWMVLYERGGNTDVAVMVDDRIKKGILAPRLFMDLIKVTTGNALEGKPVSMIQSAAPLSSADILVASEFDMVGLAKTTFDKTFLFEDLFYNPPAEKKLKCITTTGARKEYVINNNKVHIVNFSSAGLFRVNFMGAPMNGQYGELENWGATFAGSPYDGVVYDKTNKKFMYVPFNGTSVTNFPAQGTGTAFNVGNVGMDMKASDWGLTSYEYSVMSDNTGSYLMISNFNNAAVTAVGIRKVNMSACPEIAGIKTMSSAFVGQYILYGASSHVYNFKYNSGLNAELAWSAPAGEEVTCVRLQKFYYTAVQQVLLPTPHQVVYIATWNETTQTGKVYSLLIDQTNGAINKSSERVTSGYGKVKDMSYKWNL